MESARDRGSGDARDRRTPRSPRGSDADAGARRPGQRSTGRPSGQREGGPRGAQRRDPGRDQARDQRGDRRATRGERPPGSERRTVDQETYDGPPLPEDVTGKELDRSVLAQLKGLPEKLAARVARHLVAAGRLLDEDPETAYRHTLAARARAARVAVVREAVGEAAYAAGHYGEALAELRAARRMNGAHDYLPLMADCERALKRPERALELARSPAVAGLAPESRAEMTIVEAGARFDLGEVASALRTLESAPLRKDSRAAWVVRLRYAYADLLLRAGRDAEALEWFHRTAGIDADQVTDAAERIEGLERGGSASGAGSGPQR